jgi:hypothetical protein
MRLSKLLLETQVSDVFSDTFETFISDYNVIYSRNLFVVFSNKEVSDPSDLMVDSGTNLPIAFPLQSVVDNPSQYVDYAEYKYLYVIQIEGSVFHLKNIKLSHVKEISKRIGLSKEDFDFMISKFSDNYKTSNPSIESYMFSKLLFNDVEIKDEEIKLTKVSNNTVVRRLKKLGISALVQDQDSGSNLISTTHKNVAVVSGKSFNVKSEYLLQKEPKEEIQKRINDDSYLYFRDNKYMRGVAEQIAKGLGTKLNSDPAYTLFLDYYFWTVDGIEIVITVAFGKEEESDDHDNVYYVIEADTPYGVLVHRVHTDDSLDSIEKEIANVYSSHVVPNDDWEPTNRDIFLDTERREYKLFDVHYDDVVSVVDEFYPIIQSLGRQYSIALPALTYFGNFDKIFIHQFIEFIASNPTPPVQLMKELEEKDYDFNQLFFMPMPKKMSVDILKNIAMIYSIVKERRPNSNGWHLFKDK